MRLVGRWLDLVDLCKLSMCSTEIYNTINNPELLRYIRQREGIPELRIYLPYTRRVGEHFWEINVTGLMISKSIATLNCQHPSVKFIMNVDCSMMLSILVMSDVDIIYHFSKMSKLFQINLCHLICNSDRIDLIRMLIDNSLFAKASYGIVHNIEILELLLANKLIVIIGQMVLFKMVLTVSTMEAYINITTRYPYSRMDHKNIIHNYNMLSGTVIKKYIIWLSVNGTYDQLFQTISLGIYDVELRTEIDNSIHILDDLDDRGKLRVTDILTRLGLM